MRAEVLNYFRMVADRAGLPVLVDCGGMPVEWVVELAGHPNVIGAMGLAVNVLVERTREVSREVTVTNVFAAATTRMLRRGSGLISAVSLGRGTAEPVGAPAVKTRKKRVGFQVLGVQTGGCWTRGEPARAARCRCWGPARRRPAARSGRRSAMAISHWRRRSR